MNRNDKGKGRKEKGLVDLSQIKEFKVYKETTLLDFLYFKMPDVPKKNVKKILSNHQVSLDGAPVTQFDLPLYPEDVVIVSKRRIANRQRKDLPIIYEDNDLIVINKPSGLLSIASDREKGRTAYRMVADYIRQKDPKARIFVVHRLDEDTSGVLMFAKNHKTKEELQLHWQDIVKKRGYYAIVEGHMEKKEDTYVDYLMQNSLNLVYVSKDKKNGKLSKTSYKVIKEIKNFSLLDVNIDSGRKNQIRVQLGHRGHHVIGDDKYGEPADPISRLGLHAYQLDFYFPSRKKEFSFKAEMPKEFKKMFFGKTEEAKPIIKKARENRESKTAEKIKKGKRKNYFGKKR